jgi:parallel beta-helix repeat protein
MATELHLGDHGPAVKKLQPEVDRQRAPATRVSLALTLALAVAGVIALSGGRALASHVGCGEVITTDTTLDSDLVDCPNNGIVIGADNITLDLNGHLIDGDGTEASGCDPNAEVCDAGLVDDGHDGVTVMHGRVREFAVGVLFGTSTAGRVRHNRLLGISSSRNGGIGIVLASSSRSLVRNSSANGSIAHNTGAGLGLFSSDHVRVLHSSFRHNGDMGIAVDGAAHNLIKGNLLAHNRNFGIVVRGRAADRNQLRRNRSIRDGAIGIYIEGSRNVIARNRISHPFRREATGIEVDGGNHNVIARNSVRDTEGRGISVDFSRDPEASGGPPVVGNVVRRNSIRRAGKDGVHVNGGAKHTLLKRNHAFGAKDDGIDANNPTTKLTHNEARRNADLGIEAVPGVIDGGGNIASGNGDPFQCTNILCS